MRSVKSYLSQQKGEIQAALYFSTHQLFCGSEEMSVNTAWIGIHEVTF